MPEPDQNKHSFSSSRRWVMRLNFFLAVVAIVALLGMFNYLAGGYFKRFQVGEAGTTRLSPQTIRILETLTNDVTITIFFDPEHEQDIYTLTAGLLTEYRNVNPKHITVSTLDYTRFDSEARLLLARHNMSGLADKNFVLFESNGHTKVLHSKSLADYDINAAISSGGKTIRRSAFRGEMLFTSAIFAVSYPRPLTAYFLTGHGEHSLEPGNGRDDHYSKFATILKDELNTDWQKLSLTGTNSVPADCQLLIVAGPRTAHLLPDESEKVDQYLKQGGRMLLLLNSTYNSGIENCLTNWGVGASDDVVRERDPNWIISGGDGSDFGMARLAPHPILNPIIEDRSTIRIISPRYFTARSNSQTPGAPEVAALGSSSDHATTPRGTNSYALMVAVEQGVIKGVNTPRGGTRIVAVGDSYLLSDAVIDSGAANHTFASLALNWLMERPEILLSGLGPKPIHEYKLLLTTANTQNLQLLFLGGLPGFVLLVGGLVWLRRRR